MVKLLTVCVSATGITCLGHLTVLISKPFKSSNYQAFGYLCRELDTGLQKLCILQGFGIADPSVDDSITGRGVVLGRAATKLRSIETHPLTGGSTSQRLVDLQCCIGEKFKLQVGEKKLEKNFFFFYFFFFYFFFFQIHTISFFKFVHFF